MPELPEVETVVRELRPRLIGRTFTTLRVGSKPLRKRWTREWTRQLQNRRVLRIDRRGKWIIVVLSDGLRLLIHLGMTGQLTVVPADSPRLPHTHLVAHLNGEDAQLRFRDVRRFGSVTVFSDHAGLEEFFELSGLGPEPFEVENQYFSERIQGTRRCLKAVLLDQRVLAGVGNIYADESLFQARLHPAQLGQDTDSRQANRLRKAIVAVLNRAIEQRGSSIRDYIGASGQRGSYQEEFRVYQRTGDPCPRCRTPIRCTRLAGRSTHYCPSCQRLD